MALAKRKSKTKEKCGMNNCWQEAVVAGLCVACYSWLRGVMTRYLTPGEFMAYKRKVERYGGRLESSKLDFFNRPGRPITVKTRLKVLRGGKG